MSSTRSERNLCYNLCLLVVFLWLCGSNGTETDFEIFRSRRDTFRNLKCNVSQSCKPNQCKSYGAGCANKTGTDRCEYCRCGGDDGSRKGRNTFIISKDNSSQGECKRDEEIIPKSVHEERFWLKNEASGKCLKARSDYVEQTNCSTHSLDALWVWTPPSTGSKQLMNVKTLKCIRRPTGKGLGKVTMEKCSKNLAAMQNISCSEYENNGKIKIRWDGGRFLNFSSKGFAISEMVTGENHTQLWTSSKTTLPCETSKAYEGCYRISTADYSFIADFTNPNRSTRGISAPIFAENNGNCKLRDAFKSTRSGKEWMSNTQSGKLFIINMNKRKKDRITLKINSNEELLRRWNGSLLKLSVVCENYETLNRTKEEHCILVKLGTPLVEVHESNGPEGTPKPDETKSVAIAVIVTILVVAVALALGYFVYFIRRKRAQAPRNNMEEIETVDNSKGLYEDPDRIYEELRDEGFFDVPSNHPGISSDPYNFPDSTILANPAPTELEYTYAKDTDMPWITKTTKAAPEEPISPYNILEQEQPSDSEESHNHVDNNNIANIDLQYAKDTDLSTAKGEVPRTDQPGTASDLYNYPDSTILSNPALTELGNTNAKDTDTPPTTEDMNAEDLTSPQYHTLEQENPSNSEFNNHNDNKNSANPISTNLEYTQAMDTKLPTATLDKKTDTEKDTTPAPNDALYHILEQETSAPTEPQCSNPKNTNIPSIPAGMQQTPQGNSATPTDSTLCGNSLEEPNPPQTAVKSTLEEPEDEDNLQVTDEIPNRSDPTIQVDPNGTDFQNHDNSSIV